MFPRQIRSVTPKVRFYSSSVHSLNSAAVNVDIVEQLQKLPQISGGGPFPEVPQFKVVGSPPTLLRVALPASASVYMRTGSIVALNGSTPGQLTSKTALQGSLTDIARGVPVAFQKVSSVSPTSLMVSSSPNNTITLINISLNNPWVVAQRKAILGWASSNVSVSSHSGYKQWGNVKLTGNGQVALTGEGELYQIELGEGEEIFVNPTNLIAYKVNDGIDGTFVKLPWGQLALELPVIASGVSAIVKAITENRFIKRIVIAWRWLFSKENIVFKISGPKSLIIQSQASNIYTSLTNREIKEIVGRS